MYDTVRTRRLPAFGMWLAALLPALLAGVVAMAPARVAHAQVNPAPLQPSPTQPAPVPPGGAPPSSPVDPATSTEENAGINPAATMPRGNSPKKDEAQTEMKPQAAKPQRLPWRGTTLLWDQSMSTQTARLETAPQQSYTANYQWWLSFRPRWNFSDKFSFWVRLDYYKEWTNSGDTDLYREDVFGDIWNTLSFGQPLAREGAFKRTRVGLSARINLPTSKNSRASGIYFTTGFNGSLSQQIPLRGESKDFLPGMSLSLSATYSHPWTNSTTATNYGNFGVPRQDTEGRTFVSDQIRGNMLSNHQLTIAFSQNYSLTRKLSLGLDFISSQTWKYLPKDDVSIRTGTGMVQVPRSNDATNFTQSAWITASLGYQLFDELNVAFGYYSQANVIAPNGERRGIFTGHNIWWNPDARIFLDMTVSLDRLYETVSGRGSKGPQGPGGQRNVVRNDRPRPLLASPTPFQL